jgi:hypothetical protein
VSCFRCGYGAPPRVMLRARFSGGCGKGRMGRKAILRGDGGGLVEVPNPPRLFLPAEQMGVGEDGTRDARH